MKKRLWYLVLGALFLSTLMPAPALGADAGDFVVTGGVLGTEFSYDAINHVLLFDHPGTYTVSMKNPGPGVVTTSDRIQIDAGTSANPVNLTLDNVGIVASVTGSCAFDLQNTSYVNLTLEGESNRLISANTYPGIRCQPGSSITIGGSGKLHAQGGTCGAGIGGGDASNSGTITITDGMVVATGGAHGAGIGGGTGGSAGTITISGGTVIATGGDFGAGIGGGDVGNGGTVYISGGSVLATGNGLGENIGRGEWGGTSGTLTDGPGGADVYLTTVTLDGVGPGTAIHSLTTGGSYGTTGMETDTDGKLYLYLPESTHTTAAQTTDSGSPATIRDYAGDIETTAAGGSGTLSLQTTGGNTQPSNTTRKDSSHTLTNNASGLTVSGPGIRGGTKLIIQPLSLEPGQSPGCDTIRQYILDNDLTVLFGADLSLSRSFSGGLTITIPVGTEYDGQTLTLLHYHDGVLKTLTAVVVNGQAAFTLSGLSPVVLVADTAAVSAAADTTKALDTIPVTGDRGSTLIWWLLCCLSVSEIIPLIVICTRKLSAEKR